MSRASRANQPEAAARLRPLLELPAVAALARLPAACDALLVGGAIRDRLLDRAARDFDAVVAGDGERAAAQLAEDLGASCFRLGGDRFAAFRLETDEFRLDLWDRHPMTLEDDLRRRDFTINSIALRLGGLELLDPCGGLADLSNRSLRASSELAFADDPLRVLRLVRFARELPGFEADVATVRLAARAAPALEGVASERIREELRAIFAAPEPAAALSLLAELGVYPFLWTGAHATDPLADDLRQRLEHLDRCATELGRQVDPFVATQAVLFAGLPDGGDRLRGFHDRGLVSNREARSIGMLLESPDLPGSRADQRWFLHRAGDLWPTAACYLGSAAPEATWQAARAELIELVRSEASSIFAPAPLLDGHEIAELTGLEPGPRLGEVAGALRRAQIEGRVTTRQAAIEWLETQLA